MQSLRVIKLGGSLLDLDGLADRLRSWLASQPAMRNLILVGGGEMADGVRDAYRRHGLDEEAAHWLCIRILAVTAELLLRILPEASLARRLEDLSQIRGSGPILFDCEQFLREEDANRPPRPLPHTWDVTSDSIAARLASVLVGRGIGALEVTSARERLDTL